MLGLIALAERNTGVADGTRMSYSVIKSIDSKYQLLSSKNHGLLQVQLMWIHILLGALYRAAM